MSQTHPRASQEEHDAIASLADRLGFDDVRIFERGSYREPLIYATWRGAPVALSLRSGLAGGFSVAFYKGEQPTLLGRDGEDYRESEWDEIADTSFGDAELALVLGAAALEEYAGERVADYQGIALPEPVVPGTHPPLPQLIATLISDLAEDAFCASWLVDCEYELWARVEQYRRYGACSPWGTQEVTQTIDAIARLSEASEMSRTWAVWSSTDERAVSIDEWLGVYWPKASARYQSLAQSEPTCGEFGGMESGTGGWPQLTRCILPAGHAGEHEFTHDTEGR